MQTTLERLSSGLRINKASDDSAGSAISTRMSNQIQGMKQANENAQQANNLIQTAESGLNDISGMLSRMRELAVQASTDTLNDTDRASIDLEYQALKSEITRIANVTEYNEMDILNGTYYRNQVNADNSTTDDVTGVSVNNLSHDIRKGVYTLSDEAFRVSGPADISNFSGTAITNINYDASVQPGSYTLSVTEATTTVNSDALLFNTSNYVNTAMAAPVGDSPRTLTAWIKRGSTPPTYGRSIAGWGDDAGNKLFNIRLINNSDGDAVLSFHQHSSTELRGSVSIDEDTWYHIAATYDGTTQKLYVNGNLDG
ncbi:MAG: LamG-like jellyroll fold domain-containing protein, partial [Candidatus Poribacteria bacterium]